MRSVGIIAALAVTGWVQTAAATAATPDVRDVIAGAKIVTVQNGQQNFGPVHFAGNNSVVVIRSATELAKQSGKADQAGADLQQELAKVFGVDAIDWDRQMVVGVIGERGGRGRRPEVVAVSLTADTTGAATHHFLVIPAYGQCGSLAKGLALLPRIDGRIEFAPPAVALTDRLKIVTRTFDNDLGGVRFDSDRKPFVLRSAADLVARSSKPDQANDAAAQKALTQEMAKLFQVDAIDWNKQMVIGVHGGVRRCIHMEVEFVSLWERENTLTVRWQTVKKPGGPIGCSPVGLVLVPRVSGDVKFELVAEAR